jgi:hypothetical protein
MINVTTLTAKVVAHAMSTKRFSRVNTSENRSVSKGLSAELWFQRLTPIGAQSGLASVTVRVEFTLRIRSELPRGNSDQIDPEILKAVDDLLNRYCTNFTLGGAVKEVDIFGANGAGLESNAGYIKIDDVDYRVVDITLPLIINDVWEEEA